jgi:hypothetical protein
VHDGSQWESQNWTKRNVWTSANGFWITVVLKVTTSWKGSSREMKHGSTITNHRLNARVWNGNIPTCPPGKSSECIQLQEGLCLQFFGTLKDYYWNVVERGVQRWQFCLQWDAVWEVKACTLKQMMGTAVRWRCVVTRQCPFSHCCPHCCNS